MRLCLLFVALADSVATASVTDTLPTIDIRLLPPAQPWPELAREIVDLEHEREAVELERMHGLESVFNATVVESRRVLFGVVRRAMAALSNSGSRSGAAPATFLAASGESGNVMLLNISPLASPDAEVEERVDAMERTRSARETAVFDEAAAELHSTIDFVAAELAEHLKSNVLAYKRSVPSLQLSTLRRPRAARAGVAMFDGGLQSANVQVSAGDRAFPSQASLAQAMELRRDSSEHLVQARILELVQSLFQAQNAIIGEALETELAKAAR